MDIHIKHPVLFKGLLILILVCSLIVTIVSLMPWLGQVDLNNLSEQPSVLPNPFLFLKIGPFVFIVMPLVYGALSDRLGRRRLLLGNMVLLMVASLGMACSKQTEFIPVLYTLQLVGASAGSVLGYAIISDLYDKQAAGHFLINIFPFLGIFWMIVIAVSMLIGIYYKAFEWHTWFLSLAGFAGIILLLSYKFLPETYILKKGSLFSWR